MSATLQPPLATPHDDPLPHVGRVSRALMPPTNLANYVDLRDRSIGTDWLTRGASRREISPETKAAILMVRNEVPDPEAPLTSQAARLNAFPAFSQAPRRGSKESALCFARVMQHYGFDSLQALQSMQALIGSYERIPPVFNFETLRHVEQVTNYAIRPDRQEEDPYRYASAQQAKMEMFYSVLRAFTQLPAELLPHLAQLTRIPVEQLQEHAQLAQQIAALTSGLHFQAGANAGTQFEFQVHAPVAFHADIAPEYQVLRLRKADVFEGRIEYLANLGLMNELSFLESVSQILCYAREVGTLDRERYGCIPTAVLGDGLALMIEDLGHGVLSREAALLEDSELLDSEELLQTLLDAGILNSEGIIFGTAAVQWTPGISAERLTSALDGKNADWQRIAFKAYLAEAFRPYPLVGINQESPIVILTARNGNSKTTFLEALALAIQDHQGARKVAAATAQLTLADRVFDDFGARGSTDDELSHFQAQMTRVVRFLDQGTRDSLGLFDELGNGTSEPYQLAVLWAFIDEFELRGLRAVIATHCHRLAYRALPNGLEQLRGCYAPMNPGVFLGNTSGGAVRNMSFAPGYQLQAGPILDSDALQAAQQAGVPHRILERAAEILAVLTDRSGSNPDVEARKPA